MASTSQYLITHATPKIALKYSNRARERRKKNNQRTILFDHNGECVGLCGEFEYTNRNVCSIQTVHIVCSFVLNMGNMCRTATTTHIHMMKSAYNIELLLLLAIQFVNNKMRATNYATNLFMGFMHTTWSCLYTHMRSLDYVFVFLSLTRILSYGNA